MHVTVERALPGHAALFARAFPDASFHLHRLIAFCRGNVAASISWQAMGPSYAFIFRPETLLPAALVPLLQALPAALSEDGFETGLFYDPESGASDCSPMASSLATAGYRHLARRATMKRTPARGAPPAPPLRLEPFCDRDLPLWISAYADAVSDSLCPLLFLETRDPGASLLMAIERAGDGLCDWRIALGTDGSPLGLSLLATGGGPYDGLKIVDFLGTVPKARGQGVGAALLKADCDLADGTGRPLLLSVSMDNSPALRLYERFGFEQIEHYHAYVTPPTPVGA